SLRFDMDAALASNSVSEPARSDRFFRLPSYFLSDPLGATVEKELRFLARTPRFRVVFLMGFSFSFVVWFPMILQSGRVTNSPLAQNFLVLVSLYSLTLLGQVSYWNAFGFDRSAVRAYFLFPASLTRILLGKNIAAVVIIF